ncbi:capsid staple protein [Oryzomicrobium sp.]|uniref:capsid staple protein n=1 Tax=Oryzomicrobium sp. TaxID=1911578 RepID=UPI002FE0552F
MGKLIDMKREAGDAGLSDYTPPNYPGGLCLYLNEEQCEALGISKALKAGTQVSLQAKAVVTSATESLERDGDDKDADVSLSLQITDLGVTVQGVLRNAAEVLYGSGSD